MDVYCNLEVSVTILMFSMAMVKFTPIAASMGNMFLAIVTCIQVQSYSYLNERYSRHVL